MIPQQFTDMIPMLAVQSQKTHPVVAQAVEMLDKGGKHIFDVKWDGVRVMAYIEAGHVRLINRRLVDMTYRYPEVVAGLEQMYPEETRVLDGEIICLTGGMPDFAKLHRRDAQSNARSAEALIGTMPATYMVFDMLCFGGDDIRSMPLVARHALMVKEIHNRKPLMKSGPLTPSVDVSTSDEDGDAMWKFVSHHRLEGLIAKTKAGPYKSGRQQSWIKLKETYRISVIAGPYSPGKGSRANGIGAVTMLVMDADENWHDIGEVGTGFDMSELAALKPRIDGKEIIIMDVEVQNFSKAGKCRFPVFKGYRNDITVLDCTLSQLDIVPLA